MMEDIDAKLRAVLDARKKQEAAQGSGSGKGASPDSPTKQKDLSDKPGEKSGDKPAEGDKPAKPLEGTQTPTQGGADAPGGDASKLSSLSKASRDKMAAAPANVRSLFFALTEGSGTGPTVTDAAVDKYLSIVPSSLTTEEAQKLVSQLSGTIGGAIVHDDNLAFQTLGNFGTHDALNQCGEVFLLIEQGDNHCYQRHNCAPEYVEIVVTSS